MLIFFMFLRKYASKLCMLSELSCKELIFSSVTMFFPKIVQLKPLQLM